MTDETLPEEVTKHSFRQKIWDYMTKNELIKFPFNVYQRIPHFKGAVEAALRLAQLEEFKKARTIQISPDKPQQPVRLLALEANKEILVPIPKLKTGLFLHVTPVAGASKQELKMLSKIHGLQKVGKPVGVDSKIKIDLVVLGSVCVSRDGYRLGKGKGFADLEFALMMRMGAVTPETIVVSTVHDCQIVDSLPPQLFKEYDVPVDIIVTPTQTIIINPKLKKPTDIIWHMISERKLKTMQVLQQLKEMDEKDGKMVTLKEVDSDTDVKQYNRNRTNRIKNRKRFKPRREATNTDDDTGEGEKEKVAKPRSRRKQSSKVIKSNQKDTDQPDVNSPSNEAETKERSTDKNTRPPRKYVRSKPKAQIDFSLKLSNISSNVRVRDLKNALSARGVKPSEITWKGYRGICYLHFSKLRNENASPEQPVQVDSIMANLQQLRIGEAVNKENDFIIVEPAKPISRIEVTDVTTV